MRTAGHPLIHANAPGRGDEVERIDGWMDSVEARQAVAGMTRGRRGGGAGGGHEETGEAGKRRAGGGRSVGATTEMMVGVGVGRGGHGAATRARRGGGRGAFDGEVHSRWGIPRQRFMTRNLHPAPRVHRCSGRGGRESAADATTLDPREGRTTNDRPPCSP